MPLGQRAALDRAASGLALDPALQRRHCWVVGPPEQPGPWPGLVVQWRRSGQAWSARVVYLVGSAGEPTTVDAWLAAEWLFPAGSATT